MRWPRNTSPTAEVMCRFSRSACPSNHAPAPDDSSIVPFAANNACGHSPSGIRFAIAWRRKPRSCIPRSSLPRSRAVSIRWSTHSPDHFDTYARRNPPFSNNLSSSWSRSIDKRSPDNSSIVVITRSTSSGSSPKTRSSTRSTHSASEIRAPGSHLSVSQTRASSRLTTATISVSETTPGDSGACHCLTN